MLKDLHFLSGFSSVSHYNIQQVAFSRKQRHWVKNPFLHLALDCQKHYIISSNHQIQSSHFSFFSFEADRKLSVDHGQSHKNDKWLSITALWPAEQEKIAKVAVCRKWVDTELEANVKFAKDSFCWVILNLAMCFHKQWYFISTEFYRNWLLEYGLCKRQRRFYAFRTIDYLIVASVP